MKEFENLVVPSLLKLYLMTPSTVVKKSIKMKKLNYMDEIEEAVIESLGPHSC